MAIHALNGMFGTKRPTSARGRIDRFTIPNCLLAVLAPIPCASPKKRHSPCSLRNLRVTGATP